MTKRSFRHQLPADRSPTLPLLGIGMCLSALLEGRRRCETGDECHAFRRLGDGGARSDPDFRLRPGSRRRRHRGAARRAVSSFISAGRGRCGSTTWWHGRQTSSLMADARALFRVAGPATLTNIATPMASGLCDILHGQVRRSGGGWPCDSDRIVPVAFGVIFALTGAVGPDLRPEPGARHSTGYPKPCVPPCS